jgi:signal transduction histidine kinase
MLGALISRNVLAVVAIGALVGWATLAVKKHDQKVARAAVAEIKETSRAKVQVAKKAQRAIDPARSSGVLDSKYCADC